MAIQGVYHRYEWGWTNDSDGGSGTVQINFPPSNAMAVTSLSAALGDGYCAGGIRQYRTRNDDGSDQDHNLDWVGGVALPPMVLDQNMTSVTGELDLGMDQAGIMNLLVWIA